MPQKAKKQSKRMKVVRSDGTDLKMSKGGRKPTKTIQQKVSNYTKGGTKDYNFQYTIIFDKKTVVDMMWDIDLIDLAIFYAIRSIINMLKNNRSSHLDHHRHFDIGKEWYFVAEEKIIKDLPLIPINSVIGIRKRIDKLSKYGLIERNHRNVVLRKRLIDLGHNAHLIKGSFQQTKT